VRKSKLRHAIAAGAGCVCLALAVSACGSSSSSTKATTTTIELPAPSIPGATLTINGKVVAVPREEYAPGRPINGDVDNGLQVIITNKGALPLQLYAPADPTITWTNLTAKPVTVRIVIPDVTSKPIAPGGHWSFRFTQGTSAEYVVSNGHTGQIAIDQLPLPPLPTTTSPGG
jgi:hypothetical protein